MGKNSDHFDGRISRIGRFLATSFGRRPFFSPPDGFTIMELLIVLALLVLMTSMAIPSVARMMARANFKDGVFELQAELGRTRLQAMKSGNALLFRYLPGTNIYEIIPKEVLEEELATKKSVSPNGEIAGGTQDNSPGVSPSDRLVSYQRLLPGKVLFSGGLISGSTGANLHPPTKKTPGEVDFGSRMIGTLSAVPGQETVSGPAWSDPIIFHPNGRTSNAVIFLESSGEFSYYSEVALRGMTGVARVSSISPEPPSSPNFPSVLSPETFARLHQNENNPSGTPNPSDPFAAGGFGAQDGFVAAEGAADSSMGETGQIGSLSGGLAENATNSPSASTSNDWESATTDKSSPSDLGYERPVFLQPDYNPALGEGGGR